MSRCKGCSADITWVLMVSGNEMQLDPQPDAARGTVGLDHGRWIVVPKSLRAAFKGALYVSHYATCPKASSFRKPLQRPGIELKRARAR